MTTSPRPRTLAFVALAVIAVALVARPSTADAASTAGWLRDHGTVGAIVLAAAYLASSLIALPTSFVTIAAGYAYGVTWGLALIVPLAVVGGLAGFAIGRTVLRRRVTGRLATDRRFAAIDRAIGEGGFKITLLTRLSPVLPFGVCNYALSATSVRPGSYAAATALGVVPASLMFLSVGAAAGQGGPGGELWLLGAVATIALVAIVVRTARRALGGAGVVEVAS